MLRLRWFYHRNLLLKYEIDFIESILKEAIVMRNTKLRLFV